MRGIGQINRSIGQIIPSFRPIIEPIGLIP